MKSVRAKLFLLSIALIVVSAGVADAYLVEVDHTKEQGRQLVWGAAVVALALALFLSNLIARRIAEAVRALADTARRMGEGDLTVRTHLEGQDELVELGQALDRLADGLASTLGQLRGERDLQRRILEAMQEGVVVVDREGHIVLVNSALRSMLLIGAEAVGKLLIETVRHAELEDLLEDARGAHGAAPTEIELPGLKPRRLLVHASPLSGDDERVLVVFVDVTELRRLESLRREFVANASHELRTPIAAVRSATETLRNGALDDPTAAVRFLDIIERNAQRLQSLVEDMLDLSKLESNEFRLKRERVELGSVVPIVLGLFRERAEKKGVRLSAEMPAEPLAVEGDARGLEHVLSNLVDNAVKYCPAGASIVVKAIHEGERVRLIVSDTGNGIPAEHLPRLFERFYRVDAGRSRELGGTGLGLSIVKHMVEAMRGAVSVESAVGKGSTFTVSLGAAKNLTNVTNSSRSGPTNVTMARDSRSVSLVHLAVALTAASLTLYATMMLLFARGMLARAREQHAVRRVDRAPRVTILKPLAGKDDDLEANLESFARIDYPSFELLFGVASYEDPAYPVARRFIARHPKLDARVVLTDPDAATNPKVAQLVGMERVATGDVYVVSDSNVRVKPAYLWSLVGEMSDERVSMVTSLFSGTGERTVGAALENLQICAHTSPGLVALDAVTDRPLTVGKSMAIRRRDLARLGGFRPVGEVLAEDYVLGRRFFDAGLMHRTSFDAVENRNVGCSVSRSLERHTRWSKMRRCINPLAFYVEPIMTPIVVASAGFALAPDRVTAVVLGGTCLVQTAAAQVAVRALRGSWLPSRYIPLELVRSYVMLFCWARACMSRRIEWRGHAFTMKRGTEIVPIAPQSERSPGRARLAA